jgi:hypothetical protein
MLMMIAFYPINILARDAENTEVEDRIFDVKFMGLIGLPFQFLFKYADIVSAWVSDDSDHPECLYISINFEIL